MVGGFGILGSELVDPASTSHLEIGNIPQAETALSALEADDEIGASRNDEISIDGDFRDWTFEDIVSLDPGVNDRYNLDDGKDNGRDLVACYARATASALYLRVDLLDLDFEAETAYLDIYVLVDFAVGGQEWLPDHTECKTDSPWELAVALYDTSHYAVYYSDWTTHNSTFMGARYHSQYDTVEFAIDMSALDDNGFSYPSEINFQFFTTKDGTKGGAGEIAGKADVIDAVPDCLPWETGYLNDTVSRENPGTKGTAKLGIFHHGNQFLKNTKDFIRDSSGLGFVRVPEIHEYWNVPVNLHVSGTLAESAQWFDPGFNDLLRSLVDDDIVHMVGGFYDEYIPQYLPEEVNLWSMDYARDMIHYYYNDSSVPFCWMPERVFWDGYETLVAKGGYEAVMVDTEDGFVWYAEPDGFTNEHKLYEEDNGLKILFISNRGGGGATENVQDQFHNNHDGGLAFGLRESFLTLAQSPDQEQYSLYMDDWEKTCGNIPLWGGSESVDRYENTIAWIATHPWISAQPMENFLEWDPEGVVDVDDCSYFWLSGKTGSLNNKDNSGNLYDAWYYDPENEIDHYSYYDYVPKDCTMKMGDYSSPGTIIGETWALLSRMSDESPLYELAMKTFCNGLYETAWFEGDWPGIYIPYWQKEQAAHVRCAAAYYHANEWLDSNSKVTEITTFDVDLDGTEEYIISNEFIYAVFEERGGKLAYAFDSDGRQIVGNTPTGWLDEGDAVTDAVTSSTTNSHYNGDHMGAAETPGEEYLEGSKTFSFSDMGSENDIYQSHPDPEAGTVTFSRDGISKTLRLDGNKIIAYYSVARGIEGGFGIRFSFSPDLASILEEGASEISEVGSAEGDYFGWDNGEVVGAVGLSDSFVLSGTGSNIACRYLEIEVQNSEFSVTAHISKIDVAVENSPSIVTLASPAAGTVIDKLPYELKWNGADHDGDTLDYRILLDTSPTPSTVLAANVTARNFTISEEHGLVPDTKYYWTVIPFDGTDRGTCASGVWNFTIRNSSQGGNDPPLSGDRLQIIISSPGNNSMVKGNITIEGEIASGNLSILSFEIKINNEDWSNITGDVDSYDDLRTWKYSIETTGYPDGALNIRLRAFDGYNHSLPVLLLLQVNNTQDNGGDDDDDDNDDSSGDDDDSSDDDDDTSEDDDIDDNDGPDDDTSDDDTRPGQGSESSVRGKICFNVTFFFVVPMLVIMAVGIAIEVMVERYRNKKKHREKKGEEIDETGK